MEVPKCPRDDAPHLVFLVGVVRVRNRLARSPARGDGGELIAALPVDGVGNAGMVLGKLDVRRTVVGDRDRRVRGVAHRSLLSLRFCRIDAETSTSWPFAKTFRLRIPQMSSDRPEDLAERRPERDESLDAVDQTIIERLVADGRQSVNDLAQRGERLPGDGVPAFRATAASEV